MPASGWPRTSRASGPSYGRASAAAARCDDDVPTAALIRQVLAESRERLLETLGTYGDDRLGEIPPALAQRKLTMLDVLHLLPWHEAHHQGQAHVTLNSYKAGLK